MKINLLFGNPFFWSLFFVPFSLFAQVSTTGKSGAPELTKKEDPEKIEILLNWKAEPEFGGIYAAHVEGIFAKNNIVGLITQGAAGTPTIQMLAAKKADFAIVSADELAIARSKGVDVVAVYATFQMAPYAFLLHESSPINSFEDLFKTESTVAVIKGLPLVDYLAKKYGPTKVKFVPNSGGLANFMADKEFVQQCFLSSEPIIAAQKGIKTKTLKVSDAGYNPYTAVLAVNGELLKKKPELVKKVVAAVREGWKAYLENPQKTHERIYELNRSFDMETLKQIQFIEKDLIATPETQKTALGSMTLERWSLLLKQLNELKLLAKPILAADLFVNL